MNPYSFNFPYNINYNTPYMMNTLGNTARFSNISNLGGIANQGGLLTRLANSFSGIRKINWSGLLNNTSKTLGVINQAIPIVKQTGPMISNMKSMLRLASAFKDETGSSKRVNKVSNNELNTSNTNISQNNTNDIIKEDTISNNSTLPNFFL